MFAGDPRTSLDFGLVPGDDGRVPRPGSAAPRERNLHLAAARIESGHDLGGPS